MAHGLNTVLRRPTAVGCKSEGKGGIGSRRIFAPHFKLQVLDSYRNDADCKGNQRATARKYGIHRRQIQKWLQCENNLRNSVGKAKAVSLEARKCGPEVSLRSGQHRQQDDFCNDAYSQNIPESNIMFTDASLRSPPKHEVVCFQEDMRVPVMVKNKPSFGIPLDYTMHSRSRSTSPSETGAPMDLSFKRPSASNQTNTPVYSHSVVPSRIPTPSSLVPKVQSQSDIWDLSTKHPSSSNSPSSSPSKENQSKPVKLFKPYLDDLNEDFCENKCILPEASCCNGSAAPQAENDLQFYNNNYIAADYTYSLHELQPKNTINYYYTVNKNYICMPQCDNKVPFCSTYENANYLQPLSPPVKGRQCYSLDFKVSAIECYYPNMAHHGNEHTSKFNIDNDRFSKWPKQGDELHIHNESNRFMHVVR